MDDEFNRLLEFHTTLIGLYIKLRVVDATSVGEVVGWLKDLLSIMITFVGEAIHQIEDADTAVDPYYAGRATSSSDDGTPTLSDEQ
jgi:hypothetical protein